MTWRVDKTHYAEKFTFTSAVNTLGLSAITYWWGTVRTLVKGSVGIANFDGDASSKLFTMSAGPDSCNGFDKRRLAMVDMA